MPLFSRAPVLLPAAAGGTVGRLRPTDHRRSSTSTRQDNIPLTHPHQQRHRHNCRRYQNVSLVADTTEQGVGGISHHLNRLQCNAMQWQHYWMKCHKSSYSLGISTAQKCRYISEGIHYATLFIWQYKPCSALGLPALYFGKWWRVNQGPAGCRPGPPQTASVPAKWGRLGAGPKSHLG